MSDYTQFAQANPGTDYPVKDAAMRAQLTLDSDKIDVASTGYAFGYKRNTTSGLNVGYYGGLFIYQGALQSMADGTIALTASQTNYVERTRSGTVSKNTSGFTAGSIPMFIAVTGTAGVTSVTDKRARGAFADMLTGQIDSYRDINVIGGTYSLRAFGVGSDISGNSESIDIYHSGAAGILRVTANGTGAQRDLNLYVGGATRAILDTSGRLYSGSTSGTLVNTVYTTIFDPGSAPGTYLVYWTMNGVGSAYQGTGLLMINSNGGQFVTLATGGGTPMILTGTAVQVLNQTGTNQAFTCRYFKIN